MSKRFCVILIFLFSISIVYAQLEVNNSFTSYSLIDKYIKGYGISVSNAKFQGDSLSKGYFRGNQTDLGIAEGLMLATGNVYNAIGPNGYENRTTQFKTSSIPELDDLAGTITSDAAVLEFDFISIGDSIFISYIFASEEYDEWVGQPYNDVFGIFISGGDIDGYINIAKIPETNLPININNINKDSQYKELYRNNYAGAFIEYDGMTVKLKASMKVKPYTMYHCKIAIADAYDNTYDSGVFIEKGSFYSNNLCGNIITDIDFPMFEEDSALYNVIEGCRDIKIKLNLNRPPDSTIKINYNITGTATNGTDYNWIEPIITFEKGVDSAIVIFSPKYDDIVEGNETVIFNFPISLCNAFYPTTFVIKDFIPFEKDTFSDNINVCAGNYINLKGKYKGGVEPYFYQWNDTNLTGDSVNVKPLVDATYRLTVTEACGASIIDQVYIDVQANPTADFDFNIIRYKVEFDNLSKGAIKYIWDFGNGDTSQKKDAIYVYQNAGLFAVKLIVENNYGCKDTIVKIIDLYGTEIINNNYSKEIIISIEKDRIHINNKTNTPNLTVELYNYQGTRLYNKNLIRENTIYKNNLAKGLYIISIKDVNNKTIYSKKIVI